MEQVQHVCHNTLPWLISLTRDLPSSLALSGYPVHLADSQSARFSLGVWQAQSRAGAYAEASAIVYTVGQSRGSDCHCEDCRRASAAPYVTWCSVPSKAIEVLSGELRRVSYADRLRSFASCCGTPLFIQDEVSSEWIDVTVASLDDPKIFPPEVAIWTEDKLPWVKLDPSRRAFRRSRDENA